MWVSKNLASKAHDVTLISARGPSLDIEGRRLPSNLNIIQTIAPSWEGVGAEESHYFMYKSLLEKEYGSGSGIVWDNTWHCFSYLSARKFPKMKIIHTNHGTIEWQKVPVKQLRFPRYIGLSRLHAKYMSTVLKIPVRYIHNGIPLPPIEETRSNGRNGDFLLSINRIIKEKGIEDSIDLALRTKSSIKIVGDDVHVPDLSYVSRIKQLCQNSRGRAQYIGLVDNHTKIELIKECKAVIACPKPNWIEAFGLFAIEANAYGKPVLALANGGLTDIVVNEMNGFIAKTPKQLQRYVNNVDQCSPKSCRKRVEKFFTDQIMTNKYLQMFEKVLEDNPDFRW